MSFNRIFFDLDGTLTDSEEGIVRSLEYALAQEGITGRPREELASFIGPPLDQSMRKYYAMDDETILSVARHFRVRYHECGMLQENRLYPGVEDMLRALRAAGRELYVVSTKDEGDVTAILKYFGLYDLFSAVKGGSFEKEQAGRGGDYDKGEMIREILAAAACPHDDCVMIGDRDLDVEAGRRNGIYTVGVLYGYGDREELLFAGADRLEDTVEELTAYLLL